MGKVIKNKIQGMSWRLKAGLVLFLTLATTVFMYEGWYKPAQLKAATNTYYVMGDTTTALGADGTANLPTVQSTTSATSATIPTFRGTVSTTSGAGISWRPASVSAAPIAMLNIYGPVYTTAQTISGISANFALRSGANTDTWTFHLYDYDPNGAAQNGTLIATSSTVTTTGAGATTGYTPTFTISGSGVVAAGHRLVCKVRKVTGNSSTTDRIYYQGSTAVTGSWITVTETPAIANPTVTSTSPNNMTQGAGPTTVTITGTGFQSGATVAFSGTGITTGAVTFVSATTLTVPVTVAANATTGARNVTVTNPDTGTGTGTGVFTVNAAPAPTVTSTTPSSMAQGTGPTTVTITGTNFLSGATVAFSGTGITLGAVTYVSATQLTVPVTVAAGATLGARNVTVTLPGGQTGTGTGVFTVTAPVTPPTVTSTSPNNMTQGVGPTTVTITGTGFQSGATVAFSGTGITLGAVTYVNATTLTVPVTVATNATTGTRNVTVTNPDTGTGTGTGVFTVNAAPAPTVTSTSPASMSQGTGPTTVTITGTNFLSGATVAFSGAGITLGAVTYVNATTLTVPVTVAAGATLGAGNVTVTLPGGQTGTGTGVFTVTGPALPATIASCGGCHGYPGTSNPFVDVAGRNPNPVQGRFSGSHEVHTTQYPYTCSRCHVAPATETSADYAHSRGSITMANPLNANTGAKYGKGTTWAITNTPTTYLNCSATYCHSNGTSVATGKIYTNISSPRWGKRLPANTCNICHGVGGPTTGAPNYPNLKRQPLTATGATWTTPNNALLEDPNYATYAGTAQGTLILTNFGYTATDVAATDTVTGITVAVKGWAASGTTPGNQLSVQLTQNGTTGVGTAKTISLPGTTSAANNEVITTIVPTDLWGTTWTPAQITAITFGVILKDNDTANSQLNVDVVKVIIHTDKSPKMNSHASHAGYTCEKCHFSVTTDGSTIATPANHVAGTYSLTQGAGATFTYAFNAAASTCSTVGCHANAIWGVDDFNCVSCHSVPITRTKGRPGTTLAAVSLEFGQTWGHKDSSRGAVTPADCIVCHLEGDSTTGKASAYHQDGNIDLRDPDVQGETPITNITGGAFTFQRFSSTYGTTGTGARTSTYAASNTIDNVITQKFCLTCHDSDGAKNTTARTSAGSQYMPWGGTTAATYTVANGAAALNGLVNVKDQFATTNSSYHPVRAPLNRDFPTALRMNDPYKPAGTRGTSGTLSNSVVITCFDCHNTATPLTLRTVTAHGNAVTIRGVATVSGTPSTTNKVTFCNVCHASYDTQAPHGTGSAWSASVNSGMAPYVQYGCNICHGSNFATAVVRPVRALDVHGVNILPTGGMTFRTGGRWATAGTPIAFIRNTFVLDDHAPKKVGATTYTPTCMSAGGTANPSFCGNQGTQSYTVGGTY